jgi:hypothetical protein
MRPAGRAAGQIAASGELQGEVQPGQVGLGVVFTDLINLNDVGVPQPRHRLGFPAEARPLVAVGEGSADEHFQGDDALQLQVAGPVDDPHAAAADFLEDFILIDAPRRRRHGRQQAGQSGLAVGRHHRVGRRVEAPGRGLALRAALQVRGQLFQERFGEVAEAKGRQLFGR